MGGTESGEEDGQEVGEWMKIIEVSLYISCADETDMTAEKADMIWDAIIKTAEANGMHVDGSSRIVEEEEL